MENPFSVEEKLRLLIVEYGQSLFAAGYAKGLYDEAGYQKNELARVSQNTNHLQYMKDAAGYDLQIDNLLEELTND